MHCAGEVSQFRGISLPHHTGDALTGAVDGDECGQTMWGEDKNAELPVQFHNLSRCPYPEASDRNKELRDTVDSDDGEPRYAHSSIAIRVADHVLRKQFLQALDVPVPGGFNEGGEQPLLLAGTDWA